VPTAVDLSGVAKKVTP